MQKICLVIPCYNEQYRLPINSFVDSYNSSSFHYLFVNDGSSDNTLTVLTDLKAGREDRISILNLLENKGKGEAIRLGFLEAIKNNPFEIIGYMDADLATPLSEVDKLTPHIQNGICFVFGSRVKLVGTNIKRKKIRHVLGRVFATIASRILELGVYDTQCGAKFFHRSIIEPIFTIPFQTKWVFDLEIFIRISQLNQHKNISSIAKEIPVSEWIDVQGSKLTLKHMFGIPFELWTLRKYFS